jgi:hypothetical protein
VPDSRCHQRPTVTTALPGSIYTAARRLNEALDALVHEAVFLDFNADEIRSAVDEKLVELDLRLKPAGE